ncbi:MAG: hypothetical protein ACHP8A_17670, partial [Terriglobales bacterium]
DEAQSPDDNRAGESLWFVSDIPDANGNPALEIWKEKHSGEYRVRYSHGLTFYLNAAVTDIRIRCEQPSPPDDVATFLLGPVFGIVLRLRGVTCLHASAVALQGKAIAFMGPPGAGKSTTAALFARSGHAVLSDDIAALVERERSFCVLPAYPCLNLWSEMIEALGGSVGKPAAEWSAVDKVRVPLDSGDSRFEREALPLAAIYVLANRSAEPRAPLIELLPPQRALMNLVANTYGNAILDSTMRAQEFRVLGQIAGSVPIRSLIARDGTAQLTQLYDLICGDLARSSG